MKWTAATVLFLLGSSIAAQAQEAVPLAHGNVPGEPHHHLRIENEYVRVYYVEAPPHEATLLHQHDHDYIYVSLGAADVVNTIVDKPEIHLQLKDGETHFTRGGFAHVVRNIADTPFRNITIELLHPQEDLTNICMQIIPGPVKDCSGPPIRRFKDFPDRGLPWFMTDEMHLREFYMPKTPARVGFGGTTTLLVSLAEHGQRLRAPGKSDIEFSAGEVAWLPADEKCSVAAGRGTPMRFLELTFADRTKRLDE